MKCLLQLFLVFTFLVSISDAQGEKQADNIKSPENSSTAAEKVFYPSTTQDDTSSTEHYNSPTFSGVAQVLVFLIVVGAAALVIVRKTKGNFNLKQISNQEGIKILDTKSLGGKQFLVVASYEDEKVMIGVSSHGIQPVHVLSQSSPKKKFSID